MFLVQFLVHTQHSYSIHIGTPDIAWKCLNTTLIPYLAISLFGHLFPGIAKNAFPGLTDVQNVLVLVSRGLRLLAVNMHYAKCTLWTPKLQILAKTLFLFGTSKDLLINLLIDCFPVLPFLHIRLRMCVEVNLIFNFYVRGKNIITGNHAAMPRTEFQLGRWHWYT